MPAKVDITGLVFGRATVLRDGPRFRNGHRSVICSCSCGGEFTCDPRMLLRGDTTSCGCYHREVVTREGQSRARHGMATSPEYNTWVKIKGRCYNEADPKFPNYGGRGIGMCPEWRDGFEAFLRDMGTRPPEFSSIDRIDVNGHYEPGNCRWSDAKQQGRNKRRHRVVEYEGRLLPLSEACELSGTNYRSALYRINTGKNWRPLPEPPALADEVVAR